MSMDLNQMESMMRGNEDVEPIFMKKLDEKRRLLEEAQAMYNDLCANVEKANIELTGIKMERFKMECLLQESEIRVEVFEKRERELRDEAERAKASIREAEIQQKEDHIARDAYNKSFVKKVIEMAEDYCRLKGNCDKKNVSDSFHDLRASDEQLASEIKAIKEEMGIQGDEKQITLVTADPADERTLGSLRDLQRFLELDIQTAELNNGKLQAQIDQLEALKNALGKEIGSLKEIMGK